MTGSGATPLQPDDPRRIGSLRLLGVLGTGGMGRVYLGATEGEPERPGQYAAVKRVLPTLAEDPDFLRHFGHELDNLARLPADVSARLLASDRTARPPWFATEYIPGITLSEAVRLHEGPLPGRSLWRLLREAAAGLVAVHAAEMVHRDLKPSNVMLTTDGVVLIDFGVARATDQSRLTKTGMVVGTPAYMAPEQAVAERQLTGAADVFALASLMLYAANTRPPFGDGSGLDLLYRIVHSEPDLGTLPETEPQLAAVVTSCLAKDPEDRPTAAELVALADARLAEASQEEAKGDAEAPKTMRLGTKEPAAASPWPPVVAARIARRAAFAAVPPRLPAEEPEEPAVVGPAPVKDPTQPSVPAPGPVPPATPTTAPAQAQEPARKRPRLMLLAVPVVIGAGTTLSLALAPYEISDLGSGPRTKPTPTASASVTPPASAGPSGSPAPSTAGSASPTGGPAQPSGGPAPGGPAPGTPGGGGSSSSSGGSSTSSGGSSGSGGSSSSGGSGGGAPAPTTKPPSQPAPTGSHWLKNASDGRCMGESVNQFSGSSTVSSEVCGSPGQNGTLMNYKWTYKAVSGTTFRLVSAKTGNCLKSNSYAGMAVEACNGSEAQLWRVYATTSGGRLLESITEKRCLTMTMYTRGTNVCNPGDTTQRWRNS